MGWLHHVGWGEGRGVGWQPVPLGCVPFCFNGVYTSFSGHSLSTGLGAKCPPGANTARVKGGVVVSI